MFFAVEKCSGLDDEIDNQKIIIHDTWYILSKVTVKCDIEIMQNRSKGSLCPILRIHKWYLIIFYDMYIHPFFSSQILQIPNFPDTKQATTAANE